MPVIRYIPQYSTDLVIQGEQMRSTALMNNVLGPLLLATQMLIANDVLPAVTPLIEDEETDYKAYNQLPVPPREILRSFTDGSLIANNSCIATPSGALIPIPLGQHMLQSAQAMFTGRWSLTGVTRDSLGTALGGCRVIALQTPQLILNGAPYINETTSDGSGNYTLFVPREDGGYQIIAYKVGSPDVAGASRNDLIPVATG